MLWFIYICTYKHQIFLHVQCSYCILMWACLILCFFLFVLCTCRVCVSVCLSVCLCARLGYKIPTGNQPWSKGDKTNGRLSLGEIWGIREASTVASWLKFRLCLTKRSSKYVKRKLRAGRFSISLCEFFDLVHQHTGTWTNYIFSLHSPKIHAWSWQLLGGHSTDSQEVVLLRF